MPLLRAAALAIALAAVACAEDPVPGLEAQKQELLATAVPKERFWAEVERKGRAAKAARDLEREIESLVAEQEALLARVEALDGAVLRALEVNERATGVKAGALAQLADVRAEVAALEGKLAGWGVTVPEAAPEAPAPEEDAPEDAGGAS